MSDIGKLSNCIIGIVCSDILGITRCNQRKKNWQ